MLGGTASSEDPWSVSNAPRNYFFMQIRVLPSIFVIPSDSGTNPLKNGCRVAERLCLRTFNGQNTDISPISCGIASGSRFSRDQAGEPTNTSRPYKASYTLSERSIEHNYDQEQQDAVGHTQMASYL